MDPSQLLQIFSFYSAVSSQTSLRLILGINAYSSWFLLFQISIFFDLLFMGQHFVLYPAKGAPISPKITKEESVEPLVKSSDDPVSENVWSLWLLNSEDISWHLSCRIGISQLYMLCTCSCTLAGGCCFTICTETTKCLFGLEVMKVMQKYHSKQLKYLHIISEQWRGLIFAFHSSEIKKLTSNNVTQNTRTWFFTEIANYI